MNTKKANARDVREYFDGKGRKVTLGEKIVFDALDEIERNTDTVKTQNQAGHTPGPWTTDFWRCNSKKVINIGQSQKYGGSPIISIIATVPVAGEDYSDQEAANARLIACAPKMAATLRKIYNSSATNVIEDSQTIRDIRDCLVEAGLIK